MSGTAWTSHDLSNDRSGDYLRVYLNNNYNVLSLTYLIAGRLSLFIEWEVNINFIARRFISSAGIAKRTKYSTNDFFLVKGNSLFFIFIYLFLQDFPLKE